MNKKKYVLGVTGGVAAYKSCELVRLMVKAGHEVEVVMTEAATHFISPTVFQALSGRPVLTSLWGEHERGMAHIDVTRRADAFLIAPATANTLAKIAQGHCDNLLTTLAAARACPLYVAPAMNVQMWESPANLRNIEQLRADGIKIFGPDVGEQACGEMGAGRMLEAEDLFDLLEGAAYPPVFAGKNIVLTAGATFEAFDPVRGITNISSGKMGFALARACRDFGANVTLIAGKTALKTPFGVHRISVESAQEMYDAVHSVLQNCDIFIGVAAVADYRPKQTHAQKYKKEQGDLPVIEMVENPDVLASVSLREDPPFCVGFAAESENLFEYAERKRRRKKLPMLVANVAQTAMNSEENAVIIFDDSGSKMFAQMEKRQAAYEILKHLSRLYFAPVQR